MVDHLGSGTVDWIISIIWLGHVERSHGGPRNLKEVCLFCSLSRSLACAKLRALFFIYVNWYSSFKRNKN